jgi:hypothetical protein
MTALSAQQKKVDATQVEEQFHASWKGDESSLQQASAMTATN